MKLDLTGKTAVVTAAGAGIGRATAKAFCAAGAKVFAVDINEISLKSLHNSKPEISIYALDITQSEAVQKFSDDIEDVDILFNCVGYVANGGILECSEKDWNFSFDVNVKSCYLMCKAFLPGMLRKQGGSIISISSVASNIKGVSNRFCYGATKAAIIGLSKSIAVEYASKNIRCNTICPGTIDTESLRERLSQYDNPEEASKTFVARQPMGRLGTAEEIANLALYLASDKAAYTTGADYVIDGGWSI